MKTHQLNSIIIYNTVLPVFSAVIHFLRNITDTRKNCNQKNLFVDIGTYRFDSMVEIGKAENHSLPFVDQIAKILSRSNTRYIV
jgi:hypothetical protein